MRVVADVTSDDMIIEFLRAEIASTRFGEDLHRALARLGGDVALIHRPDLTDPVANELRRRVLAEYRGYPRSRVFAGLSEQTAWQRVLLTPAELFTVRYIRWDWWIEVTGGTRNPADALHYYRDDPACRAIADGIAVGRMPPPLILVANPGPVDMVVLEGHLRLTAMIMAHPQLPAEIPALLGTAPGMDM